MAKKIDLQTITIEKIIVHDIPHHKKSEVSITPSYSEKESSITDGLRLFFKDKVVQALGSDRAFKICYDDESTSTISWLVSDMLKSGCTDIVTTSKAIAKQLFDIQIGNNAAGILVVIFGKVNSNNTCIILKLERDKGAQLTLDPKTHSYNIQEVQDLMLTQKTKIFKVALFVLRDDFSSKFDGVVMDFQIDVKVKKDVVTFFIEKFLGCRAFEDPKIKVFIRTFCILDFLNIRDNDLWNNLSSRPVRLYSSTNRASRGFFVLCQAKCNFYQFLKP